MAWDDDEENQEDGAAGAFVYGSGPQDDPANAEAYQNARETGSMRAVTTPKLPPAALANMPGGNPDSRAGGSNDDDFLQPPKYNPTPLPAPPSSHADQYRSLEQTLAAKPPSPNDPGLKPGIGRRVGAGIASALMGFGRVPGAAQIGTDALYSKYNKAEGQYEQQQQAAKSQLSALRDQSAMEGQDWEHTLQAHNAGIQDFNAQNNAYDRGVRARDYAAQERQRLGGINAEGWQPDDPAHPEGGWHGVSVGGQKLARTGPPDEWLKTSAGKAWAQTDQNQRRLTAMKNAGQKFTPDEEKYFLANGKLAEPKEPKQEPEGKAEYDDYISSLGHPPTTDDILNYRHGTGRSGSRNGGGLSKSLADRIESQKQTALEKARQNFGKGDNADYTLDDYLNDWQQAQDDFEQRISDATGQDVPHLNIRDHVDKKGNWIKDSGGQQQASGPAPGDKIDADGYNETHPDRSDLNREAATAAPPRPSQQANQNDRVQIRVPDGKGGWNTGTIPRANLPAALKRGAQQIQQQQGQ